MMLLLDEDSEGMHGPGSNFVPDLTSVSMEDIWGPSDSGQAAGSVDASFFSPSSPGALPHLVLNELDGSSSPLRPPTLSRSASSLAFDTEDAVHVGPPQRLLTTTLSSSSSSSSLSLSLSSLNPSPPTSFLAIPSTGGGGGGAGPSSPSPLPSGRKKAPPSSSSSSTRRPPSSSSSSKPPPPSLPPSLTTSTSRRNARQKMDSYERKKTRAKLCRRVLKERFDTLLYTLGDPSLRRADKCGILTAAIDSLTAQREQPLTLSTGQHPPPALRLGLFPSAPRGSGVVGPSDFSPVPSLRRSTRAAAVKHRLISHEGEEGEQGESEEEEGGEEQGHTYHVGRQQQDNTSMAGFDRLWEPSGRGERCPVLLLQTFLDPASLESCRGVSRQWHEAAGRDGAWRELCTQRWRGAGVVQVEQLWAHARHPHNWRQAYVRLHRQSLPPSPLCFSPSPQALQLLGRGSTCGLTAWLLPVSYPSQTVRTLPASCVPGLSSQGGGRGSLPVLLPLRLVIQNTHSPSPLLVPFQPLQLSTIKCPGGSSATRDRAKRHRPDNTHDKDATLFREVCLPQLLEGGMDEASAMAYVSKVVGWNGTTLKGHDRVPWTLYQEVGGMRLGLFESATISFWVVAPGCLSWGDLAVRASGMALDVLTRQCAPPSTSTHHLSSVSTPRSFAPSKSAAASRSGALSDDEEYVDSDASDDSDDSESEDEGPRKRGGGKRGRQQEEEEGEEEGVVEPTRLGPMTRRPLRIVVGHCA